MLWYGQSYGLGELGHAYSVRQNTFNLSLSTVFNFVFCVSIQKYPNYFNLAEIMVKPGDRGCNLKGVERPAIEKTSS